MADGTSLQAGFREGEANALRMAVKSARMALRSAAALATRMNPGGKLAQKAGVILLDMQRFDDLVAEAGGVSERALEDEAVLAQAEENLVFIVCAQVASGVTLTDWCRYQSVDRGLVWALLTETPDRYARYERALRGVADELVGDVVGLAARASVETVAVDKLQIDTNLKVGVLYDPGRFGKQTKVTHEVGGDFGERLRRARERVVEPVEDAVVIEPAKPAAVADAPAPIDYV